MRLFSYIVRRDFGFAPNPFYGVCTLATCKPDIRGTAAVGDWVIGTGGAAYKLQGHLIFAMQVSETLSFDGYWSESRFACKRPILNGSLKQVYGDNIYHHDGETWVQIDSHHSLEGGIQNESNVRRDTKYDRVLLATRFVYFGATAPEIPEDLRNGCPTGKDLCCSRQERKIFTAELPIKFETWLEAEDKWGLQGWPCEFYKHSYRPTYRSV